MAEGKYKVEMIADSSGEWCSNAMRFDTVVEAEEHAKDLASRWVLVEKWRVVWTCDDLLFRDLTLDEVEEFRRYAMEQDPPDLNNWDIYHPVCRATWEARGIRPNYLGTGV